MVYSKVTPPHGARTLLLIKEGRQRLPLLPRSRRVTVSSPSQISCAKYFKRIHTHAHTQVYSISHYGGVVQVVIISNISGFISWKHIFLSCYMFSIDQLKGLLPQSLRYSGWWRLPVGEGFHYYHIRKKGIYTVNLVLALTLPPKSKMYCFCSHSIGQITLCVHAEPQRG